MTINIIGKHKDCGGIVLRYSHSSGFVSRCCENCGVLRERYRSDREFIVKL